MLGELFCVFGKQMALKYSWNSSNNLSPGRLANTNFCTVLEFSFEYTAWLLCSETIQERDTV